MKINHCNALSTGAGAAKVRKAHSKQECDPRRLDPKPAEKDPTWGLKQPHTDAEHAKAFQGGADRARTTLQNIPGTELETADKDVTIDMPDTHELKSAVDGVTVEHVDVAFANLVAAFQKEDEGDDVVEHNGHTRTAKTAASEASVRARQGNVCRRATAEAETVMLRNPHDHADGYITMADARKFK